MKWVVACSHAKWEKEKDNVKTIVKIYNYTNKASEFIHSLLNKYYDDGQNFINTTISIKINA